MGNYDRNSINIHSFDPVLFARFVRIYPRRWQSRIGLRVELYGCPHSKLKKLFYLFIHPLIYLASLPSCLPACLSVILSICLSVILSVSLSVILSVSLSVNLSVNLSININININ